ncbi:MAG: hypothetical protein D8B60_05560 [Moraxella sp.]|nr:MAG: hypothetical protein D8B60_05560 [Moraxella sp.]
MSVSLRTSSLLIYPMVSLGKDDTKYYKTEITEPKEYNIEFSPDGGNNPKQMQAIFEKCAQDGVEVDIVYVLKNGRFGQSFVVYDIKPKAPVK